MDHKNNTQIQKKGLWHSVRKVNLALLHHLPEASWCPVNINSCPNGLLKIDSRTHSSLTLDTSEENPAISAREEEASGKVLRRRVIKLI